jgi:hypothetical protein
MHNARARSFIEFRLFHVQTCPKLVRRNVQSFPFAGWASLFIASQSACEQVRGKTKAYEKGN